MLEQSRPTLWLTRREAAFYAKVNAITLLRAVKAGKLRAFRLNDQKHVRFRAEDLDAWLSAAPIQSEVRS